MTRNSFEIFLAPESWCYIFHIKGETYTAYIDADPDDPGAGGIIEDDSEIDAMLELYPDLAEPYANMHFGSIAHVLSTIH